MYVRKYVKFLKIRRKIYRTTQSRRVIHGVELEYNLNSKFFSNIGRFLSFFAYVDDKNNLLNIEILMIGAGIVGRTGQI